MNRPNLHDFLRRHTLSCALSASVLATLVWAALAPLHLDSHDQLFDIPTGTWARRMAGDKAEVVPSKVRLTLGVRDVLLLRNSDTVPQIFGPVRLMPGQEFRLPFERVAHSQFACSARVSGLMTVIVEPLPNPGLARLQWRLGELAHAIRTY